MGKTHCIRIGGLGKESAGSLTTPPLSDGSYHPSVVDGALTGTSFSPCMHLASQMPFGMRITNSAFMVLRLVYSKGPAKYASKAS